MRILIIFSILTLLGCKETKSEEMSMVCVWFLEGANKESFIFNLNKNSVYWVNENQRIEISELNEGEIIFKGVRSGYGLGSSRVNKKFTIEFSINRVTGQLDIKGINVPSPYNSSCNAARKII